MNSIFEILIPISAVIVTLVIFFLEQRRQRLTAIERNIDVLQRLNEQALASTDDLLAAARSVNIDDRATPEELRMIFFHFLRINRLLRAWEMKRARVIRFSDYKRIMKSYAGTLTEAKPLLPGLCQRGYPDKFVDDLEWWIDRSEKPQRYDIILKSADAELLTKKDVENP